MMGNLVSEAINGIGNILGDAIAAPFKSAFGTSCEEVCKDPWGVVCFIEHLCVSNLIKFALIAGLCYLILLFFYILCKIGVCKCIGKSLCKMCWAAFSAPFRASYCICRFLWRKLMNTKRVYRGRYRRRHHNQQDIEAQYMSPIHEATKSKHHHHHHYHHGTSSRKRKSFVVYPSRRSRSVNLGRRSLRVEGLTRRPQRHSIRLRRRRSIRVQGLIRRPQRYSRHLQRDDSRIKRQRLG